MGRLLISSNATSTERHHHGLVTLEKNKNDSGTAVIGKG